MSEQHRVLALHAELLGLPRLGASDVVDADTDTDTPAHPPRRWPRPRWLVAINEDARRRNDHFRVA